MSRSKKVFIVGVSLILVLVVLLGCLPNKQGGFTCIAAPLISKIKSILPTPKKDGKTAAAGAGTQTQPSTGLTRPHPPVRTGAIATGTKTQVASQSIDSSGGTMAVNKPGDPLDGLVLDVPAKSYADGRTFKVSSASITNQTFGNDINPVSPMIYVDNGGGYSDEVMYIRVPVKVTEGKFAMGFLYDEKSKQLEGMPLVGRDADSITVATRHFSNFFISTIEDALLKKDIDSGFRPGIDDWQFDNNGSYIAPGHCSGQSIAAMWYYYAQPDGKEACLYGRYDNNGNQPATPDLWQDDSLGYRFCSTIHCDYQDTGMWGTSLKWDALAGIGWKKENNQWKRIDVQGISDASTWRLFAYSIQASGQPQYVSINSNAGGWHAMICYAVSDNNTLRIADPNYHGRDDRKIEFVDNKFKPYNSGANKADIDAGNGKAYEKIIYRGAWTIMPYDQIAQRWTEFKNKTIGNDRFPAYTIQYEDSKGLWQELKDGYISQEKLIKIQASFESEGGGSGVYRDGAKLPNGPKELKPGNNLLGIYIAKDVADHNYEYVDFKYINVIYGSLSIDPATLDGELNKQYTFTAKADSPPTGACYDWYVDGSKAQSNTSTSYSASFKTDGSHKVSVKLVDSTGKEIQEAEAAVTIKSAGNTPALVRDCKYISFLLNPKTNFVHNFYKDDIARKNADTQTPPKYVVNQVNIPVTWSGVNFSGKYKGKPTNDWYSNRNTSSVSPDYIEDCTISGRVTADGKTISQLKMTLIYTLASEGYVENWQYEFTDIPLTDTINTMKNSDASLRNQILEYQVYSSNNAEAHGKFSATYQGKPEKYRSLDGEYKMTDGKGTAHNTMWEYYNIPELGAINFGLKVNTAEMNGL